MTLLKKHEFIYNNFELINESFILSIKKKILSKKISNYKVCFHKNRNYPVQEMINFFYGFNYNRPHKHINQINESYHLIEGEMEIYLLSNNNKVFKKIKLKKNSKNFRMFKINKPIYHFIVPSSKWLIYHEVTTGPWSSNLIKYASFAPENNDNDKGKKFYEQIKEKSKKLRWHQF